VEHTFTNTLKKPLEEVFLHLYPNRLLRPNPALNDVNYSWSYPRTFDPGYMEMPRVGVEGEGVALSEAAFVERKDRPRKTLMRLRLQPALPPGKRLVVHAEFETVIPRKYGTFGRYGGAVLLNGGWFPYLPALDPETGWQAASLPPRTRFDLTLERPEGWEAVVNGVHVPGGGPVRFKRECRFLTLALAEEFHKYTASGSGAKVTYYRLDPSSGSGRRVCQEAARVLKFYTAVYGPVKGRNLVFMEGHFRTVLTSHGDGVGLTSDRILRVLPYPIDLRKYHLREVAFETLYQLVLPEALAKESSFDWNWVAEGIAWARLREYLHWRTVGFDEVTDILSTFSFIPIIDQTLVAPRFPFNDVFFDTFFKSEALREGILRYNNRIPFGRLVIEKARDVLGKERWERAMELWRQGKSMPAALEEASGESMDWFVKQWRGGYPRMNYRIGKTRAKKVSKGRIRITTEILRDGGGDFVEIAELGVKTDDGRKFLGRVRIAGPRTEDSWIYPESWDTIIVDPRGRIRETNKTDNRIPRKPKILVTAFNPRLEWELESPVQDSKLNLELFGGFAGILQGDYANQVHLTYFYNKRGVGSSFGYFRAFNMKLDRTDFKQGVGAFFYLEQLHRRFALAEQEEDETKDDNLIVTSFQIFYTADTRIDRKNPHNGASLRVALEVAEMVFGTDFSFKRFFWDLRWLYAPQREHILAFQTRGGFSWGCVPAQRRYSAGGYYGVRGVPENEGLGTQSLVFRWEYRHMIWHDLNVNFFWFGWLRKVQGVVFLETGVADDHPPDLFRLASFRSGTGYGIRIEFDSFGVRPFLVGLDMGWRLDEVGDQPIFYLTVSQSF
jgi:hypothetical protein